jgi:hypothetical protein
MSATNHLLDIWRTYNVTVECLKVTQRSVYKGDLNALEKTSFITSTVDAAKKDIQESRSNVDDYVILSLWAAFERHLFSCIARESERMLSINPSIFTQKVLEEIEGKLEYWRVDDALDIFKVVIDAEVIGQAKKIKRYRDWVAHKNPKKLPPEVVTPERAYRVLLEITRLLDAHPNIKSS